MVGLSSRDNCTQPLNFMGLDSYSFGLPKLYLGNDVKNYNGSGKIRHDNTKFIGYFCLHLIGAYQNHDMDNFIISVIYLPIL